MTTVYVVMKHFSRSSVGRDELQGVFSTKAKADRYASAHRLCVLPVELDEELPVEPIQVPPRAYYPKGKKARR